MFKTAIIKLKTVLQGHKWIAGAIAALFVVGGSVAMYANATMAQTTASKKQSTNAYQEEPVTRGDITVGISEVGSSSMDTVSVAYDFATTIELSYVTSGTFVQAGDAIAKIDMEAYEEVQSTLAEELADAKLSLEETQLNYDSQLLQLEKTYHEQIYAGTNAQALYDMTIAELENNLSSLYTEQSTLQAEYDTANSKLAALPDVSSYDIDVLEQALNTIESTIATLEAQLEHADTCPMCTEESNAQASATPAPTAQEPTATVAEPAQSSTETNLSTAVEPTTTEPSATIAPDATETPDATEDPTPTTTPLACSAPSKFGDWDHDVDATKEDLQTAMAEKTVLEEQISALKSSVSLVEQLSALSTNLSKVESEIASYHITIDSKKLNASASYDTSMYHYNNAEQEYNLAVAQLDNKLEIAQEKVNDLLEQIEAETALVENGIVLAPCDGYIISIAEADTTLTANKTIATIGKNDTSAIYVSIDQEDIGDISVGMKTYVVFDAYEDYTLPATVESISLVASGGMSSSVSYDVTVRCNLLGYDESFVVFDGMTSTVTFVQKEVSDVLLVSNKCVTTDGGQAYVKMIDASGEIVAVPVETGFSDGFDVEIVSGLQDGDVVILESAVMFNAS